MSLTCGAKGTRTPDPLVANNRQHVHPRLPPQVSVRARFWPSAGVRTCCGTFVLYMYKPQREGLGVPAPFVCQGNAQGGPVVSADTSILTQREKHT